MHISCSATSSLTDPSTCPENWPGISCDPETVQSSPLISTGSVYQKNSNSAH
ncbi:unnamed protein product [Brassica oleracea]